MTSPNAEIEKRVRARFDVVDKEFRVGDLFEIGTGSLLNAEEQRQGVIPRISVKTTENAILGYFDTIGNNKARHFENVISVNFFGNAYYHPYLASFDMKVHTLKIPNMNFNRETGLYFTSALNQIFKGHYSYGNQLSSSKLKEEKLILSLPTHRNGQIAFDYMAAYIKELEAERIKELEAYLKATGLNDYILTDDEKAVLKSFRQDKTRQDKTRQDKTRQA